MNRFILLLICLTSLGCATTKYVGPTPNLTLKLEAAEAELERFELKTTPWTNGLRLGSENTIYSLSSLMPVVETVPPPAVEQIQRYQKWQKARSAVTLGLAAVAVGLLATSNINSQNLIALTLVTGGLSITAGFVSSSYLSDGVDRYNRDLKQKLTDR